MSNAELSKPDSSLWVKDIEGALDELSQQVPLPEGGLLRGEVVRIFAGGTRLHLREIGRCTVEVRLEEPLRAERGDLVEVAGKPELVSEATPVGLRVLWKGPSGKNLGLSDRFRARRAFAEEQAAKLSFETPRISARLRNGGRVRVVTTRHSRARKDIEEAARQYRWLKPEASFFEDLEPRSIAAALESLIDVVQPNDVVLITRDAGEVAELDAFEDERVVAPLARLTQRCATILAVGHVGDDFMTGTVVTYPSENATGALRLILRESRARINDTASDLQAPAEGDEAGAELADAPEPVAAARPPQRARSSSSLGTVARVLLLGAAAYLGWWARGWSHEGVQAQRQLPAATLASAR
ncbi:MAG TPA: hypothetical protein VFS67_23925 [Polyangiaceae bacterium]|jgi:hypothetical protein|nr:hypothetical protein [Polyangiaceae bacterium]